MNAGGKQRRAPSEPEEIRRYCKGLGFTRNLAGESAVSRSGGVRNHAITAVALGAIERLVGALEDRSGSVVHAERRKPDRERHVDRLGALIDREWLAGNPPADAFRDQRRDGHIGLR